MNGEAEADLAVRERRFNAAFTLHLGLGFSPHCDGAWAETILHCGENETKSDFFAKVRGKARI